MKWWVQLLIGVLSVVAVVGAVAFGANTAEMMTPVVALAAILATSAQGVTARQHAETLARLEARLGQGAVTYQRRLDAYAQFLSAFRTMVNKADSIVRTVDHSEGTPAECPTTWYWRDTLKALEELHASAELLRLLADSVAIEMIDHALVVLDDLDAQSTRNQNNLHPTEDAEDLRSAAETLRGIYRNFVAHARQYATTGH
jgi:hypothetical protein